MSQPDPKAEAVELINDYFNSINPNGIVIDRVGEKILILLEGTGGPEVWLDIKNASRIGQQLANNVMDYDIEIA